MSFRSVHKKLAPYKAWLRCAYGNAAANIRYCKKSGDFYEHGTVPVNGADEGASRWELAVDLARKGQIEIVDAQTLVTCVRSLERIEERHIFFNRPLPVLAESRNVWVIGPTRCGKSSILTRLFRPGDVYRKIHNKNWCNYRNQPVVL